MNQVLDFSKIVSLERQWRHRRTKELPQDLPAPDRLSHLDSSVPFDLAILTEEVVEGVCLGHAYGRWTNSTDQVAMFQTAPNQLSLQNRMYQSEVEVAIDIAQNDWVYQAQPGALRRIIMNVFGNALKYTDTGRVSIHLSRAEADENIGTGEDLITLVVSDTGKGMSQVFLSERLYTPFAQEDSMAAGTGLGLSIVRSLVKALNGSIRIHSRPGEGTAVKITLSLGRGEATPTVESPEANRLTSRPSHKAARAAILGVDIESTSRPVWGVIAQYLTEWYGLELVSWPSQHPIDILLTDEQKLSVTPTGTVPALLILSSQTADQDALRTKWSSVASYVDIVHPPCGPHKLGKSISKITDSLKRGTHITTLPERPPPPPPGPVRSKKPPPPDTPVHRSCTTHPTPRILLVDDNAINLNLIHTFLRKQHLTTFHTATNGSDAVTAVSESNQSYDIIFMDMSMPIMDGFEATRAIREIEREKGTGRRATIIALTGLSSSRDEEDALGSGVDLFLTKPVSLKEVGRYLTEWRERVE